MFASVVLRAPFLKSWVWCYTFEILALMTQRQANPWSLLIRQARVNWMSSKPLRDCFSEKEADNTWGMTPKAACLPTHMQTIKLNKKSKYMQVVKQYTICTGTNECTCTQEHVLPSPPHHRNGGGERNCHIFYSWKRSTIKGKTSVGILWNNQNKPFLPLYVLVKMNKKKIPP